MRTGDMVHINDNGCDRLNIVPLTEGHIVQERGDMYEVRFRGVFCWYRVWLYKSEVSPCETRCSS